MPATSPDIARVGAVLQQRLADLRSPVSPIREEARLFVARGEVRWWDETRGMGGAVERQRRQPLPPGRGRG